MTTNASASNRLLGALRADGTVGAVRIEDRIHTGVEDLWSALTHPERLARWYGHVAGDLRRGGQFTVYLEGPDLSTLGRIEECEPPRRLLVRTRETEESASRGNGHSFEQTMEATLTPDVDHTLLVVEVAGLPLDKIAAYGVGWQLHAESLAAYLSGRTGPDVGARWAELAEPYDALAAKLG